RMNPSTWGTPLTTCAPPSVSPPLEQDRVTVLRYDPVNRIDRVTTGAGTAVEAHDITRTFTPNGRLSTLVDAQGNKTADQYDGHDRPVRTWLPHPSSDGAVADSCSTPGQPCDYTLVGYMSGTTLVPGYDENGNVTDFTTRRGERLHMTYDYLDRLITKE